MILLLVIMLLCVSFVTHLLWWRINMPARTTIVLLFIFMLMPIMFYLFFAIFTDFTWSDSDVMRIFLLYLSCALTYIIIYSAIEQQSPTLAIIGFIHRHPNCDHQLLMLYFNVDGEMKKRVSLMEMSGLCTQRNNKIYLTKSGEKMARIFDFAARFFGLKRGG